MAVRRVDCEDSGAAARVKFFAVDLRHAERMIGNAMAHTMDLSARKRQLIAQSELHRQILCAELAQVEAVTSWIPKAMQYARMVTPILAVAVPLAGFFFRSRKHPAAPPAKKNWLAKMLAGYQVARRVKPIWDGLQRSRGH